MKFHTILTLRSALVGRMQHSATERIVKQQHPIAFGILRISKGNEQKEIRILFDSGATSSFLSERFASKLRVKNTATSVWKTGNGSIETCKTTETHFVLPELYNDRIIEHTFHLLPTPTGYEMIVGTNLMSDLGIKLNFQDATVEWDEASIPFKNKDAKFETDLHIEDSRDVRMRKYYENETNIGCYLRKSRIASNSFSMYSPVRNRTQTITQCFTRI